MQKCYFSNFGLQVFFLKSRVMALDFCPTLDFWWNFSTAWWNFSTGWWNFSTRVPEFRFPGQNSWDVGHKIPGNLNHWAQIPKFPGILCQIPGNFGTNSREFGNLGIWEFGNLVSNSREFVATFLGILEFGQNQLWTSSLNPGPEIKFPSKLKYIFLHKNMLRVHISLFFARLARFAILFSLFFRRQLRRKPLHDHLRMAR